MIEILEGLLQYNPGFRPSTKDCLENAIFKDIRDPYLEQPAQNILNLKLFEPHCFDYEKNKFAKLQSYDLYKMLS